MRMGSIGRDRFFEFDLALFAHRFILQPENLWSPFFQKEYRDPRQYIPYSPQLFEDPQNLEAYVSWLLERPVKAQDGR